jgi:DNA-binding NarL/FixJ family response regulator
MHIKILLADDHRIVRDGIEALFSDEAWLSVVGSASTGLEAIQKSRELQPDVIIMDIAMPEMNGIEACQQILQTQPSTKIIMLSMHSTSEHIYRAFQAGAKGYLLKDSAGDELINAIRAVQSGERYITQRIASTILDSYLFQKAKNSESTPLNLLSQREREVLQLVAEGYSSKEIALKLSLSTRTTETYRSRIMQKLELHDLPSLIHFCIENGITPQK